MEQLYTITKYKGSNMTDQLY